ncbi:MAG TPA: hypothetical protein VMB80_16670 [Candidatus Acidoferrum sp.]|nr:hypothetical protein [Candidatus Acidoferrum sp.]
MKHYLSTALTLVCVLLVLSLVVVKRGDNAQHQADAGAIADFSNRLASAQAEVATGTAALLALSNRLDESRSASMTFSNHLLEAESTVALNLEQITNLNRRIAELGSENQTLSETLDRRVMALTNQMADLARQIASTESNRIQANIDYAFLENRLHRDVAERLVMQRKFYNPSALQTQLEYLKTHPIEVISSESIYAGLDVEVSSNRFHVLSSN